MDKSDLRIIGLYFAGQLMAVAAVLWMDDALPGILIGATVCLVAFLVALMR